ncbi:MAG: recombinase family protein [Oscillospiraceae bacterium]|nr:recombinase family protein [Oscillospiraceae bacterium]
MRQSIKNRDTNAALYVRLSRDDGLDADSNSIQTQKKLLSKTANEKGYTNLLTFCDDGISGVTMNRPGYNEMLTELEKGYIGAVFVKDLSRLGRNYIEVGKLTDEFLPDNDIRLVSVADGVDSNEGDNDLNPIRNLFNEFYARDISRKRRISNKVKGHSGEPLSPPPYGYIKNPDNPKSWIIDPEAAAIVRRIFQMSIDGKGIEQIADTLTKEKILTPISYWQSKGINKPTRRLDTREPYHWNSSTVSGILNKREYVGDIVNFKTYSKSYKNKKRIENAPENMAIFTDVHEPIIDRATWERIQDKRGKARKRKTADGQKNIFSGLVVCADCGHNLHYHFNQGNHNIKYFNCSNYNNRGSCPTTHYIRVDFLEQVVLQEIHRLTRYAKLYELDFADMIKGDSEKASMADRERKQKELYAMQRRDRELDNLFNRMYEDNVSGKIDDSRFAKMSSQYTAEQKELTERIKTLTVELDRDNSRAMTADMFISTVRKYTRAKKLTERMLGELIERIEVHQSEKVDGAHRQRLTIHYNCVGSIEIPETFSVPDITVQTRKGVMVRYDPPNMTQ